MATAEDHDSLRQRISGLATATRQSFDIVAEKFAETDRQQRENARQLLETGRQIRELSKQTDDRIAQLVSAIGEFIRQRPN